MSITRGAFTAALPEMDKVRHRVDAYLHDRFDAAHTDRDVLMALYHVPPDGPIHPSNPDYEQNADALYNVRVALMRLTAEGKVLKHVVGGVNYYAAARL